MPRKSTKKVEEVHEEVAHEEVHEERSGCDACVNTGINRKTGDICENCNGTPAK